MGDEYGDKDEISLQIFGLGDSRESSGDCRVRSKLWMIVLLFICACNGCADVRLPGGTNSACKCTRLPEKGATTGSIIGALIGVIILLAIIGTAIAMYRKHRDQKDGPPKYKPPPPKKTNSSAGRVNTAPAPVVEDRPLTDQYYSTQSVEPVTDLDTYHDEEDDGVEDREHYYSAAPSGWDDPRNNEVPPPYMRRDGSPQDYHQAPNVNRGESFVSSAMFV